LRSGETIEAKVTEITSTEIRYLRYDNQEGPTRIIRVAEVLSIRFENGTFEIFNAAPTVSRATTTAMDPDILSVGIVLNPIGFIAPGITLLGIEFTKGNFNTGLNLLYQLEDSFYRESSVGVLGTINRFWHSRIGGAYLGAGIGYMYQWPAYYARNRTDHSLLLGLNVGYTFVTPVGIYFRTGGLFGASLAIFDADLLSPSEYFNFELAVGFNFSRR
jgi:hypothetical protein